MKNGGCLLVEGSALTHDLHGSPLDNSVLFENTPKREDEFTVWLGRGKLVYHPGPLTPSDYSTLIDDLSEEIGVERTFRVRQRGGERTSGILARGAIVDGELVVSLVNYNQTACDVSIKAGGDSAWHDLVNDRPAPKVLHLKSLEPRMLIRAPLVTLGGRTGPSHSPSVKRHLCSRFTQQDKG